MMIRVISRFFTLVVVCSLAFLFPIVTTASANNFFISPQGTFIASRENTKNNIKISEDNLTPQERQKMQAVRQRRNRDILAVLDDIQRQELAGNLHKGSKFKEALNDLNLSSEQRDLINAIFDFTNLKIKGIFSHHALLDHRR
jgi:Spy/CpxP family protein refolding chaperone